eukprot:1140086-Pelagomonas_calceolata.AAC.6
MTSDHGTLVQVTYWYYRIKAYVGTYASQTPELREAHVRVFAKEKGFRRRELFGGAMEMCMPDAYLDMRWNLSH